MPDEPLNNEQIEPSSPLPINTTGSEPSEMPPEAPESPINADIPVSLKDANEAINEPNAPSENEGIQINEPPVEPNSEPISEPEKASEPPTDQISRNEPLNPKPEELPLSASLPEEKPPASPEPKLQTSTLAEATPPVASSLNHLRELQVKEQLAIKNKKQKKIDGVMVLLSKKSKITNDEVEKFLHVSDATATRYLSTLEKEGKIKKNDKTGKTGKWVSYSKI